MTLKIGITCYPTVGGSGVIATELGKMLAEKGHEVHFITSSVPFRLNKVYPNIYYHEVEVNQYSVFQYPPYDLSLASKIADVADRYELDVIHVHYAVPHAICALLAKQMTKQQDLKIITTLHGTDITVLGYDPSLSRMIRLGIEQSDVVTAVSNDLAKQTKDLLDTSKPIQTVYNFVDQRVYYQRENHQFRQQYNIKTDEKIIVHISNFRPVKRITDIIHSFAKVQAEAASKLLLIGDGPEITTARELVRQLDLDDHVLFLGNQKRVAELLSMSDVMLLLSEKESFGLVALEAMACGVPVVGTRTGGVPEVVADGETGFICDVGDIDAVAAQTLKIVKDSTLKQNMAKQAIERVEAVFHADKIVEQYEEIYYQAIKEERRS